MNRQEKTNEETGVRLGTCSGKQKKRKQEMRESCTCTPPHVHVRDLWRSNATRPFSMFRIIKLTTSTKNTPPYVRAWNNNACIVTQSMGVQSRGERPHKARVVVNERQNKRMRRGGKGNVATGAHERTEQPRTVLTVNVSIHDTHHVVEPSRLGSGNVSSNTPFTSLQSWGDGGELVERVLLRNSMAPPPTL